ncbi:HET-domain-containing protein, partial [Sporormia fimetaria CBS 119925]
HPPLDHAERQIRLLQVREKIGGIHCALQVFSLDACPAFVTLSYVWGHPDTQYDITLNGRRFLVRQNLYAALYHIAKHIALRGFEPHVSAREAETQPSVIANPSLDTVDPTKRLPNCWKYIWIDALCINQEHISERNPQVRLMSEIHKSATFVLVWLGSHCETAL